MGFNVVNELVLSSDATTALSLCDLKEGQPVFIAGTSTPGAIFTWSEHAATGSAGGSTQARADRSKVPRTQVLARSPAMAWRAYMKGTLATAGPTLKSGSTGRSMRAAPRSSMNTRRTVAHVKCVAQHRRRARKTCQRCARSTAAAKMPPA